MALELSGTPVGLLPPEEATRKFEALIAQIRAVRGQRRLPDLKNRAFTLQLDTINTCNLQCKECAIHLFRDVVNPTPMRRETLAKVGEQVFPYCFEVNFAALAEPWMSPVIEEAIDLARAKGVPVLRMISNGLLLTEARARKLIDVQFDLMNISTDAATPEAYKEIRGGNFEKVVQNIARLRDLKLKLGSKKPSIQFNFVMLKSNLRDMPKMVDLSHELGAEKLDFRLPFLIDRQGIDDDHPARAPELMDEMILQTRARAAELGIEFDQIPETNAARRERGYQSPKVRQVIGRAPDETAHCEAPWGFLVIWPTGDIHPCCSPYMLADHAMGSLEHATFAQIITGPAHEKLRDELVTGNLSDNCAKCLATDFLGVNELHPDSYVDIGPRLPIAGVPGGRYKPLG